VLEYLEDSEGDEDVEFVTELLQPPDQMAITALRDADKIAEAEATSAEKSAQHKMRAARLLKRAALQLGLGKGSGSVKALEKAEEHAAKRHAATKAVKNPVNHSDAGIIGNVQPLYPPLQPSGSGATSKQVGEQLHGVVSYADQTVQHERNSVEQLKKELHEYSPMGSWLTTKKKKKKKSRAKAKPATKTKRHSVTRALVKEAIQKAEKVVSTPAPDALTKQTSKTPVPPSQRWPPSADSHSSPTPPWVTVKKAIGFDRKTTAGADHYGPGSPPPWVKGL